MENGGKSRVADALGLRHPPVALLWADEAPEGATRFKKGGWGCVMWLVAAAAKGRTAACDRETFGCFGGGVGLGFGDQYRNFPGGMDCFCRFLSTGNEPSEEGRRVAEAVKPHMAPEAHEEFLHGERYLRSPELVARFAENLPMADIPARFVVFRPLTGAPPRSGLPRVVIFLANPHQIAALVVLVNYDGRHNEHVTVPFAAGCQSIGIYPYREAESEDPRAVLGLVDLSARLQLRPKLGDDLFTFAVPWKLFERMEANVAGSFLERPTWRALRGDPATPR
ncbi:MAG: DUF169 domain-containing protein [Deferrisomatales bacterium]|nr:DUF169 domain-containing protein [Deferrisomatales bacterium]